MTPSAPNNATSQNQTENRSVLPPRALPLHAHVEQMRQQLEQVGARIVALRQTLIQAGLNSEGAEVLAAHIPGLEAAVREMEQLRSTVAAATDSETGPAQEQEPLAAEQHPKSLAADLLQLQQELARAGHLAGSGQHFWQGWAGLLGLDTGYTQAGLTAPLTSALNSAMTSAMNSAMTPAAEPSAAPRKRISVEG